MIHHRQFAFDFAQDNAKEVRCRLTVRRRRLKLFGMGVYPALRRNALPSLTKVQRSGLAWTILARAIPATGCDRVGDGFS